MRSFIPDRLALCPAQPAQFGSDGARNHAAGEWKGQDGRDYALQLSNVIPWTRMFGFASGMETGEIL